MNSQYKVLLDTNVIFPPVLRDTLLRCAQAGMFEVCWSPEILNELERNLLARSRMDERQVRRLFIAMANAFPDALVGGFERHIPFLRNDPKDRHVVAAAVEAGATAVVTFNVRDFAVMPDGIIALAPTDFLLQLLGEYSAELLQVLREQANHARQPPSTLQDLLERLAKLVKPFTDEVRALLADQLPDAP